MGRNEDEAQACEDEATEARRLGLDQRAERMQHRADYLREQVRVGDPEYRPVGRAR